MTDMLVEDNQRVLGIIPARGGSKGLPGKNILPFAGLPLIVHSILFSQMCSRIDRCIVTTDSEDIAKVAREYGGDVPFIRDASLASDDTPMWPVLKNALDLVELAEGIRYDFLVLLDPTSPSRQIEDVSLCLDNLMRNPEADGVVSVSQPDFNPIWHGIVSQDGWMADLMPQADSFSRRQDVPTVYRINGCLYVWRTAFVRADNPDWRNFGRHLIYEISDHRAMSIDSKKEFEKSELLVAHNFIKFPWLNG